MLSYQEDEASWGSRNALLLDGLRDQDVVCGRDKLAHSHAGNRRFRKVIHAYRERYQSAKRRDEKTRITTEIINMIALEGGRFVRLDEPKGFWVEIDAAA